MSRTRGKGKLVASSFNDYRFRSEAHEECYNLFVVKKKIIPEVEFQLGPNKYQEIQREIIRRNWQLLNNPVGEPGITMVHKFYTNAWEGLQEVEFGPNLTSYVRGTEVHFGTRNIKRILHLGPKDTTQQDYSWRLENNPRLDDVMKDICIPGAHWTLDARGQPCHIKRKYLIPVAKGWQEFVHHNIVPTSNMSELTVQRAVLVHSIMEGTYVNVGKIISQSIYNVAQSMEYKGILGYPFLIRRLCEDANASVEEDFPIPRGRPITAAVMERDTRRAARARVEEAQQEQQQPRTQTGGYVSSNQSLDAPISRREFLWFRNEVNHKLDYLLASIQYVHQGQIPLFHQTPWSARRFDGTLDEDDPRYNRS